MGNSLPMQEEIKRQFEKLVLTMENRLIITQNNKLSLLLSIFVTIYEKKGNKVNAHTRSRANDTTFYVICLGPQLTFR